MNVYCLMLSIESLIQNRALSQLSAVGAQNATYELADAMSEYTGFISTDIIASGSYERSSTTFFSRS